MTPDDPVQMVLAAAARRRRAPVLRPAFAGVVLALVGAFALSPGLRGDTQGLWRQSMGLLTELEPAAEPTGAAAVAAEAYVPERAAAAGGNGANVRDYPLLSGDLIVNLPARTPLNITGRLNVQGRWWFRVALDDGTIGFVREDAIRWGVAPTAPSRFNVDPIEPAIQAVAGRAGARIRVAPGTNARQVVRLSAAAPLTVTGRLRQGAHWWLRVELEDGRTGFARDDVLRTPAGGALDLPA